MQVCVCSVCGCTCVMCVCCVHVYVVACVCMCDSPTDSYKICNFHTRLFNSLPLCIIMPWSPHVGSVPFSIRTITGCDPGRSTMYGVSWSGHPMAGLMIKLTISDQLYRMPKQ